MGGREHSSGLLTALSGVATVVPKGFSAGYVDSATSSGLHGVDTDSFRTCFIQTDCLVT